MNSAPVTSAVEDGVARITLNRPAGLNALDTDLAAALAEHAEAAAKDDGVTLVVVRGAGRAFCSGMDRTALAAGTVGEAFYRHWIRALNCLEDMPKLAIAVAQRRSAGACAKATLAAPTARDSSFEVAPCGAL